MSSDDTKNSMTIRKKSLKQRYNEASRTDILIYVAKPLLSEFFVIWLHVFWGSMIAPPTTSITYPAINRTIHPQEWAADYVVATLMPAFQAGFAVWVLIVMFWHISIIHFNPAISSGFLITGVLSPWMFIPYVIVQCIGSILGALAAKAIKGDDIGSFGIDNDADIASIFFFEVVATGAMMFLALHTVVDETFDESTGPFAIGFTVFQGIIGGKWIGAGVLNPARVFGPTVVLGGAAWNNHWVWWVADCTGAVLFCVIYMCFFAPNDKVWMVKLSDRFNRRRRDNSDETIGSDTAVEMS